jgi:P27 family predicted phage terminase small subunit
MRKATPVTRRAPAHLQPETRRWWKSVVETWELQEHHVRLLTLAAEAWDRGQGAREAIARDGLTTPTRDGGLKLSPLVRIEQMSAVVFARVLRELDLDLEPPAQARRPPHLRSIVGG